MQIYEYARYVLYLISSVIAYKLQEIWKDYKK